MGTLLTGIVVSRGSNYTSDFIKRLQNPDIGEIVLEDVIGVADAGEMCIRDRLRTAAPM